VIAALLAGLVPLIPCYLLDLPGHQVASALLLFPLFLATVREARPGKALGVLCLAYLAHSAGVVFLSVRDPDRMESLLPGARSFWTESLEWVETGFNPEYRISSWVPEHLLLFIMVIGLAYCSLGLTVLLRGFYEVDLMNYYVGRLIAQSSEASTAVLYGWHIWSLTRGLGCAIVLYEIASLSFGALTGTAGQRLQGRRWRLGIGMALLLLDGLLKFFLMGTVQARLQANLL
jgi:hypothetical protein